MKNKDSRSTALFLAQGAIIAAMYVALTIIFAPISFGAVQVRVAELLTILPLFTPAAIPGLFIGCIIANGIGGGILLDVVFGSLATLIGASLGYLLRFNRWLVPIPAIVANSVIVPFVLKYGYGIDISMWLLVIYIAIGEIIGCYVLGELFASVLLRRKELRSIFKNDNQ
ncbi:MAG: QueT transporter family protein [Bacillota bacterium]